MQSITEKHIFFAAMKVKRLVAAAIAILAVASASANTSLFTPVEPGQAVLSGLVTHHVNAKKKYSENNYGVGYRSDSGYSVGYYRNSEDRDSFYMGREFQWYLTPTVNLGFTAGVVSGYRNRIFPLFVPEIVLKLRSLELALVVVPPLTHKSPVVLGGQIRYKF